VEKGAPPGRVTGLEPSTQNSPELPNTYLAAVLT
jgi:hypothetical protein